MQKMTFFLDSKLNKFVRASLLAYSQYGTPHPHLAYSQYSTPHPHHPLRSNLNLVCSWETSYNWHPVLVLTKNHDSL